jgi:hypothetical protein
MQDILRIPTTRNPNQNSAALWRIKSVPEFQIKSNQIKKL